MTKKRTQEVLRRMAESEPELAARLVVMTLPAAAAWLEGPLAYDLAVEELGTWRVGVENGGVTVAPPDGSPVDFRLATDAQGLAELAAGSSPLKLLLGGRVRIRGSRIKARKLGAMSDGELDLGDVVKHGGKLEPDVLYRALPYLVEPGWTRGHSFTVRYVVEGERGGTWYVHVRDGQPLRVTSEPPEDREVAATATVGIADYERMASGELTPTIAMQDRLTEIAGEVYPVTLIGRWIERSLGRDDEEQRRESEQRAVQQARAGGGFNGASPEGQGDPAQGSQLLGYRQLYALWEQQNWRASELDFTVDKEQWLATPTAAQESTIWSLGSFYVGEERVTADLAPFLLAAPSGEIELFLGTQLVDEARHAAFFDRFGAEVMALSANDLRGRMREVEEVLRSPWREVFDDGLRDVASRIKARPDDFGLFVEGITTYHLIIEGFLAVTGQTMIRQYMLDHGLYPGFCEGFGLVERDEHRHIAFGVRFLKEALEQDPAHAATIQRAVHDLAPRAAYVFVPPYVKEAREFVSYGYTSQEIYGYAYRALKRRMGVLGLAIPPPEELMPGPIGEPATAEPAAAG